MKRSVSSYKNQTPAWLKILTSPKLTLMLGIIAFTSVVLYQRYIGQQLAPPAAQKRGTPVIREPIPKEELVGPFRDGGPTFAKSFFKEGDLFISLGQGKELRWGILKRKGGELLIYRPNSEALPLLRWLNSASGGRFAIYREPRKSGEGGGIGQFGKEGESGGVGRTDGVGRVPATRPSSRASAETAVTSRPASVGILRRFRGGAGVELMEVRFLLSRYPSLKESSGRGSTDTVRRILMRAVERAHFSDLRERELNNN